MSYKLEESESIFQPYLDSIHILSHSESSVQSYLTGLRQFRRFVRENLKLDVLELVEQLKLGRFDVYEALKGFVIKLDKEGKSPASIKSFLAAAKGYLRQQGIKIYGEDFRLAVRIPKRIRYREEPLTKEIIVRLLHNVPSKLQAAILFAISSGVRIGELVQIRISDVDFESKPTKVRIRAEITKGREARETFLTQEATVALKDHLKRYFGWKEGQSNAELQNTAIFGRTWGINSKAFTKNSPTRLATAALEKSLVNYVSKIPELAKVNENGRYVIHFHAFRKFFRTTVGDAVGRDFAEALMGHHFYLDTYYNLPEQKRREMYLKAEPYLTISDISKLEKDMAAISERQREIEVENYAILNFFGKNSLPVSKTLEKYLAGRNVKTD